MNVLKCLLVGVAFATISAVDAQVVFISNNSFESPVVDGSQPINPDDWGYYASGPNSGATRASGVSNVLAQSGSQSLYLTTNTEQGAGYEAHYLKGMNSFEGGALMSLTSANEVTLSFYIRSDVLTPFAGDAVARFSLEFHDSTQVGNPNVGGTGTLLQLRFANDGFSTTDWVQVTLTGNPNAFSDNILFVADYANFPNGDYNSSSGTFYLDNLSASVVPEPESVSLLLGGMLMLILAVGLRKKESLS